mgnify:CR=1 FL=1
MKDNILYIAVVMAITAMLLYTVDYERKIEILQDELDNKEILIDSLFHEIDTLTWEQEIWDFNISKNRTHLLSKFTYNDRWSRSKSIKMFDIYCKHYGLTTAEEIARCWNGGPKGMENSITAKYWKKVENQLSI